MNLAEHLDVKNESFNIARSALGTWRFGIVICLCVLATIIVRDLFGNTDLYPAFLLPFLILAFVMHRFDRWHLVILWSVLGVLVAELVAFVFGLNEYIVFQEVAHTSGHAIIATSIHLVSEIILSAVLAAIGARITLIEHGDDGILRSIEIKQALNLRLLMFVLALPLLLGIVRSIEARVLLSLLNVEISAWVFLQSDLLGYFMLTPLLIGVTFTLVGAPDLNPSLRLNWWVYSIYVGSLLFGCGLIAAKIGNLTFQSVAAASTLFAFFGMLTSSLQIAGSLLLLNYAALLLCLQYVEAEPLEVMVTVIVLSVGTYVIMLLRVIAQFEMNNAQKKVEGLLANAQTYLESGMNAYIIQNHEFDYVFMSRAMTKMTGYSLENIPQPSGIYANYSVAFNDQHRQRLLNADFDEVWEDSELLEVKCYDGSRKLVRN